MRRLPVRRIPLGAAVAAMVVAGTTASAFAVAGKVPSPVSFQSASSSHEAPATVTAPPSDPGRHKGRDHVEPPKPVTTTTSAKPAGDGDRSTHEPAPPALTAPPAPPLVTVPALPAPAAPEAEIHHTETPPTTGPAASPTSTTEPEHHDRTPLTTPVTVPTTAPTTAPAVAPATTPTTEKPVSIPFTMTLACATGTADGVPAARCTWSTSDSPQFASYRFFKAARNGAGQILLASTDRSVHSFVDKPLTVGASSTYTIQSLDAAGHILASSPSVTVTCCSQTSDK